jgi:long-chain acyl-CoA synthetase
MRAADTEHWSYSELLRCAACLAAGLGTRGLEPGDRALLLAPNSVEWVVCCLALLEAGVIPVPVDSQSGRDDLGHIVEDSGATSVFTTAPEAESLSRSYGQLDIVLLDRPDVHGTYWRELIAGAPSEHVSVDPHDCAVLFYTSGTSGPPKGVPLSHANLLSNLRALTAQNLVQPDDRLLLPLPLHHVYPFMVGLFTPLYMGMSVIFPRSLLGEHFFAAMNEGEVTILLGVPRLYEALLEAIDRGLRARSRLLRGVVHAAMRAAARAHEALALDLGHWMFKRLRRRISPRLRLLVSGGSPLERETALRLQAIGWQLASGYGLTETSPILTFNLPGASPVDSAGKPLPGVQLRIAAPEPGFEHGEVQAQGPSVFSGYRNLPDKTRAAFTADGWFRTGDLGYFDRTGALHLVGRASSMIVLPGGENVVPENLETLLEQSPLIAEIGILEHGGRLVGIVVPVQGTVASESGPDPELEQRLRDEIAALSQGLPSFQRLGAISIDQSSLPRTRLGKIRRHKLAERYAELAEAAAHGGRAAPTTQIAPQDRELLIDPVGARVWAWLGERFAGQVLTPDTHLRMELAVDSLEWLNLTLEIRNRIGIELGDEAVARVETIRDLLQACVTAEQASSLEGGDLVELLRKPESLLDERYRAWFESHPLRTRVLDAVAVLLARLLMRALFRFRFQGVEHLPAEGAYVLAPNHCSALDPIALAAALGRTRLRQTYWGGWTGILYRGRIASLLSRAMRVLPVDPESGHRSNLGLAAAALHRDCALVWFPEGMRSPTGELQAFRAGIGLLLRAYPVPAVPVWIEGTRKALLPGSLRLKPTPVSLRFGEPATAAELEAEGAGATPEERIASGLRARVQRLGESVERA